MERRYTYVLLLAGLALVWGTGAALAQDDADEDEGCAVDAISCCDVGGLNSVADVDYNLVRSSANSQEIDIQEDDVLLGIALAHNGVSGVSWDALRDITQATEATRTESRIADLDREDVFSTLALGVDAEGDSLAALACVSDTNVSATHTTTMSRAVDLEEEEVLLAIALKNSVGGEMELQDVADIAESESTTIANHRDVTVEREDTFLALALGAGGNVA